MNQRSVLLVEDNVHSGMRQDEFLDLFDKESDHPLFISKPFDIASLRSMLSWHLEQNFSTAMELPPALRNGFKTTSLLATAALAIGIVANAVSFAPVNLTTAALMAAPSKVEVPVVTPAKSEAKFDVHSLVTPELKKQVAHIASKTVK